MPAELDPDARDRLLELLAAGASVSAAARSSGYTRQHVHRLLKEKRFAEDLAARRGTPVRTEDLAELSTNAARVRELERIALDALEARAKSSAKDSDQIAAARELLHHARELGKPKPHQRASPAPPELRVLPPRDLPDPSVDDKEAREWLKSQEARG